MSGNPAFCQITRQNYQTNNHLLGSGNQTPPSSAFNFHLYHCGLFLLVGEAGCSPWFLVQSMNLTNWANNTNWQDLHFLHKPPPSWAVMWGFQQFFVPSGEQSLLLSCSHLVIILSAGWDCWHPQPRPGERKTDVSGPGGFIILTTEDPI